MSKHLPRNHSKRHQAIIPSLFFRQSKLLIAILFVFVLSVILILFTKPKNTKPVSTSLTPMSIPNNRPTSQPLFQGKQTFRLSHGKKVKGPKISEVIIDPFDPKIGEKQTVTVYAKHDAQILQVRATLHADNSQKTYTLSRIGGTDLDGVWEGSWTTEDTHNYTYYAFFELISTKDSFQGGLTFR